MNKWFKTAQSNSLTIGMILFVFCFYSFLFMVGHAQKKAASKPSEGQKIEKKEAPKSDRITAEDLRKREELFKKRMLAKPDLLTKVSLTFLFVFLVGLLLNIILIIGKARGSSWFVQSYPQGPVAWGLGDVCQVFAFLFFIEAVILIVEILFSSVFNLRSVSKDVFLMLNSLLRDIFVPTFESCSQLRIIFKFFRS